MENSQTIPIHGGPDNLSKNYSDPVTHHPDDGQSRPPPYWNDDFQDGLRILKNATKQSDGQLSVRWRSSTTSECTQNNSEMMTSEYTTVHSDSTGIDVPETADEGKADIKLVYHVQDTIMLFLLSDSGLEFTRNSSATVALGDGEESTQEDSVSWILIDKKYAKELDITLRETPSDEDQLEEAVYISIARHRAMQFREPSSTDMDESLEYSSTDYSITPTTTTVDKNTIAHIGCAPRSLMKKRDRSNSHQLCKKPTRGLRTMMKWFGRKPSDLKPIEENTCCRY